ncbi:MAG: HisA/HisF-related TIM barrel protein [Methanomicrobiales archaeon]
MELVLAMDFKDGLVVHGRRGDRVNYLPLTWGASPVADPEGFIRHIKPHSIYIADLDRITGSGSHNDVITRCNGLVSHCYADRGCRGPEDLLSLDHFENVIGTETAGDDLGRYKSGYLSIDVKDGKVIPSRRNPVEYIRSLTEFSFDGCILLDISGVGTSKGLDRDLLVRLRESFGGKLLWGGGVASADDLGLLENSGFDGAIIATALHKNKIPIEMIRRGIFC